MLARLTIGLGVVLVLLGLGGYFGTGMQSITALIPAFVGLPLVILGAIALKDAYRKHAMHAAMLVALLGLVGAAYRPVKTLATGGTFENPTAATLQGVMAVLCLVYLVLGVKSFIDARRARGGMSAGE